MKKFFIFLIILAMLIGGAFVAQIFYMGSLNQKFYTQLKNSLENQNGISLTRSSFEKGFLTSKANLTLIIRKNEKLDIPRDLSDIPLNFDITFYNDFFAPTLVSANLKTPPRLREKLNLRDNIVKLYLNKNLFEDPLFKIVIENTNLGDESIQFGFQGLEVISHLNKDYQFVDSILNVKKITLQSKNTSEDGKLEVNNLNLSTYWKKPISFEEYFSSFSLKTLESSSNANLENLKLIIKDEQFVLNNLTSSVLLKPYKEKILFDINVDFKNFKFLSEKDNIQITLNDLRSSIYSKPDGENLLFDINYDYKNLKILSEKEDFPIQITLNDLRSSIYSKPDGENLMFDTNLNFDSLSVGVNIEEEISPKMSATVKDFTFNWNINNIPKKVYSYFISNIQNKNVVSKDFKEKLKKRLLASKPNTNFSANLKINDNNIQGKGFIKVLGSEDDFELSVSATSEVLPSKIFPSLPIPPDIDTYFIKKDQGFEISYYILKEGKNTKSIFNGNEIISDFNFGSESPLNNNKNIFDENFEPQTDGLNENLYEDNKAQEYQNNDKNIFDENFEPQTDNSISEKKVLNRLFD